MGSLSLLLGQMRKKIENETIEQWKARKARYQKKYSLRLKLFKAMERYWTNYNGKILGRQRGQVAPAINYQRSPRKRKLELTLEDLAYVKDYEGVALGKYNF